MATIQQRANKGGEAVFRAIIRRTGYKAMTATFGTDEEARFWAAGIERAMDDKLDVTGGEVTLASSVRAMLAKFVREVTPKKRGAKSETYALNMYIERFKVLDKTLADFGARDLEAIIKARLEGSGEYDGVCGATVRRELGMLSGAFTHAIKKWHVGLTVNPVSLIDRPASNPHRTRRVVDAERKAVCASLDWVEGTTPTTTKQRVAWAFCFALETAMRRGEIIAADWAHYDARARRLHIPKSKNGDARDVPISARARDLLDLLGAKESGEIVGVVANTFQNVWNDAKKGTARADLHFHDARHEATTRFAKLVPTVLHLQKITGHRDIKSLLVYFNPEADELAGLLDGPAIPPLRLAA
jgi:integrase